MFQCFQLLSLVGSKSRDRFVRRMGEQQAGMWHGLLIGTNLIILTLYTHTHTVVLNIV